MSKVQFNNKITSISFPNTVKDGDRSFYLASSGIQFQEIFKNGEMSKIKWFAIWYEHELIAEIKESVCDISFKETL